MKIQSELKERVSKGLNYGLEAVEKVLSPKSKIFNQFILIKSKYNDLMHFSSINVLPYDELEVGFDKLRSNLIRLIDNIQEVDVEEDGIQPEIQNKALPYRRENFFRLLDIHFKNLEGIYYEEQIFNPKDQKYEKDRWEGREAVFNWYSHLRRRFSSQDKVDQEGIQAIFGDFFTHEIGSFDVYFKHIKHMANYIQAAEIDQQFFFDTLIASLSRYELAMLFYYTIADIDPDFRAFATISNVFNPSMARFLIDEQHLDFL